MEGNEMEKSKSHFTTEIIEYISNSIATKIILKKPTGNISIMSFDSCQEIIESVIPFDNFVQIIDGKAEIVINGESNLLSTGQSIIIPAHASNFVKPNGRFKMIQIVIKSGYEQVYPGFLPDIV